MLWAAHLLIQTSETPFVAFLDVKPKIKISEIIRRVRAADDAEEILADGSLIIRTSQVRFYYDKDLPLLKRINASATAMRTLLRSKGPTLVLSELGEGARELLSERVAELSVISDTTVLDANIAVIPAMKVFFHLSDGSRVTTIERRGDAFSRLSVEQKREVLSKLHERGIPTKKMKNGVDAFLNETKNKMDRSEDLPGLSTRFVFAPNSAATRAMLARLGSERLESYLHKRTEDLRSELVLEIARWRKEAGADGMIGKTIQGDVFKSFFPDSTAEQQRWRGAVVKDVNTSFFIYVSVQPVAGGVPYLVGVQLWP